MRLGGVLINMNIVDLTSKQLKRAAAIKEQIGRLNIECVSYLEIVRHSTETTQKTHHERGGQKENSPLRSGRGGQSVKERRCNLVPNVTREKKSADSETLVSLSAPLSVAKYS